MDVIAKAQGGNLTSVLGCTASPGCWVVPTLEGCNMELQYDGIAYGRPYLIPAVVSFWHHAEGHVHNGASRNEPTRTDDRLEARHEKQSPLWLGRI